MADLLVAFISGLLEKAGLDKAPEPLKSEQSHVLAAEASKRLGLLAVKELSPEALAEYAELVDKAGSPGELAEFFQRNIPDFEAKATATLKKFADEFLADAAKLPPA